MIMKLGTCDYGSRGTLAPVWHKKGGNAVTEWSQAGVR